MRVAEVMTKSPVTVTMDTNVNKVAAIMAEKDVGFLPIVDEKGAVVYVAGWPCAQGRDQC